MTVLGDAACEEDWHRNNSCGIESHEDHVWAGLRDDADGCCQEDHQDGVVADPMVDINVLKGNAEYKQHTESPCEYHWQMLLYDVVPEMLVDEMVGSEQQYEQHDDAQPCKQHVHPIFAQQVDVEGSLSVVPLMPVHIVYVSLMTMCFMMM